MNEPRRGTVVLLHSGDAEITGAIAQGMLEARAARPLPPEQIEVVKAEVDRQKIMLSLLRVAVNNDKTAEDYRQMVTKARGDYGRYYRHPGPVRRFGQKLMGLYGLVVYAVSLAHRAQERVLGR